MFDANNSSMNGAFSTVWTVYCLGVNLRKRQEYFKPQIGRKNKKIQPGPEKQLTYVKKMSVIRTYLPS